MYKQTQSDITDMGPKYLAIFKNHPNLTSNTRILK